MVAHCTPKNEPHARTSRTLFRMNFARTHTRATANRTCACAHAPSQLLILESMKMSQMYSFSCTLYSSNLNLQILVKVYDLLINEETRIFYDYGGVVDSKGRNILLNIEKRPKKGDSDRDISMSLFMDSHGMAHHHFHMSIQKSFADQSRYVLI